MKWRPLTFGKHKGKTIPQILLDDPDWFFYAVENEIFRGHPLFEANIALRRSKKIILKGRPRGSYAFEWTFDQDGRFCSLDVIDPGRYWHVGSSRRMRTNSIDLSELYNRNAYDKRGYKRLLKDMRRILFGDKVRRLTRERCDAFFSVPDNFG